MAVVPLKKREEIMRKLLIASAASVALLAGSAITNDAKAGTHTAVGFSVLPYAFGAGLLTVFGYLIRYKDAPAGWLAAAGPDDNMRQFAANAKQRESVPAYAFVPSDNLAAVPAK